MTHQPLKTAARALAALALAACSADAPDLAREPSGQFTIETVADSLSHPWAVAALPNGGGYLVTGKLGQLWRVDGSGRTDISGLPAFITAMAGNRIATEGQGGLLDVALAPDFAQTGELFLSYSYGNWGANGTALLRATLDGNTLRDAQTIFRAGPPKEAGSHYGGKIVFTDADTMLLSLGDAFALREEAQKPTSHLGSVVRLARDGSPASDNPDFGEGAMPELFTVGHRNVQGLALDSATGEVWEHEHGPKGGDELNRLQPGANYGWPIATYGVDYQGAKISPITTDARFEDPVHYWVPSIAPSGLAIYRGDLFPWDGDALVGGLASGDLRRVDMQTGEETILLGDLKTGADRFRVRDVDVEADGAVLLLIEDAANGRLLRLLPG